MRNEKFIPVFLFVGAFLIFLYGLNSIEIIMIDTRFGLFVREMTLSSILSPYPYLYHEVYPDYSSLPVYLMYLASLLTGSVNQLALALPSAIVSALLVMMTYRIGKKMLSPRFGLVAALLILCSFEFLNMARLASIDAYPALLAAICFELVYFANCERRPLRYWQLFGLFAAGYAFRGPIGTVIPVAAAVAGVLPFCDWKRVWRVGFTGVAALCLMTLLYFAWTAVVFSSDFFGNVLYDQVFGRISSSRPVWYYFVNGSGSYAITLPMALIAMGGYYYRYRLKMLQRSENPERIRFQALALFFLLIVLGMSIPGSKHLRYIFGALVPAGLLAAYVIENPQELYLFVRLRKLFYTLARWLPGVLFVGLVILQAVLLYSPWLRKVLPEPLVLDGLLWGLPLLLVFALADIRCKNEIFNLTGVVVCFAVIHIAVIEQFEQSSQKTALFVSDFEAMRPTDKTLFFYALGPDGDENKYMLHVKQSQWFIPLYAKTSDEIVKTLKRNPKADLSRTMALEDLPPGSYVMARLDRWEKFPLEFTECFDRKLTGRIGNRDVLLLEREK